MEFNYDKLLLNSETLAEIVDGANGQGVVCVILSAIQISPGAALLRARRL
jgi:hypothetical protein